ncbi:hypothetical protein [Streptomyces sp. NPDC001635]|nr:hypothetical protein E4K10_47105 [Streptomyces sp. T1317-0309]
MKKSTTRTIVIAPGAGATLLSIVALASTAATAAPATSGAQAAADSEPTCGLLDGPPGGPCSSDDLGDGHTLLTRNLSVRTIKSDTLQADWVRR